MAEELTPYAKAAFLQGSNPTAAMAMRYKAAESTDNFDFVKGAISQNLLGDLSQGALQASPQNPASNSAQKGDAGSNQIQKAYQAVNQFWQGNPDAPFIESLGREDQSKLQQLAVNDPQEYYRELGRRKSFAKEQMTPQTQFGGGGGGSGRPSQGPIPFSFATEKQMQIQAPKPFAFGEDISQTIQRLNTQTFMMEQQRAKKQELEEAQKRLAEEKSFGTFTRDVPFAWSNSGIGTVGRGIGMATF